MRSGVALAAAAGVLAAAAVWFFTSFERVPVKQWVGPSGEAQRNPFLAAERFAARMGHATGELRALPDLDRLPHEGTVLIPSGRQALDARRVRHLVAWVEAGGHLVAEAEPLGVADPLLAALGVQRKRLRRAAKTGSVTLPDGRTLSVSLAGAMALEPAARDLLMRAGAPDALQLASFEHGRGLATVATSLRFARNEAIGTHQNAAFLWQLLTFAKAADVRFYLRPERLSLWAFLGEHAAQALAALAALVALWVWRVGPRFGPVQPDPPPARRRLLDHLRASGRYYWARGLSARLVLAARDAALRRVARVQPDFADASAAERAERLARLAGIAAEEAKRFLAAVDAPRGHDLVQLMRVAQRVHSALERGNR